MNFLKKNGAGLLLCLAISIPAWFLGKSFPVIGGPVFAILIGMVLTLILKEKEPFTAGINYTSKKILQAAVIFLGFGMNLSQILAGGKQSLPIIISTITTSLIIAFILYKALKLKTNNAILVGVGSSHMRRKRDRRNRACHRRDGRRGCSVDLCYLFIQRAGRTDLSYVGRCPRTKQ